MNNPDTVNGIKLYYETAGQKDRPEIFFLHGKNSSHLVFKHSPLNKLLNKDYRLIFIDRPGSGLSRIPDDLFLTLEEQTKVLSDTIREVSHSENRVVVGHSLGTLYSLSLLLNEPDLFKGAVLISPYIYRHVSGKLLKLAKKRITLQSLGGLFKVLVTFLGSRVILPIFHPDEEYIPEGYREKILALLRDKQLFITDLNSYLGVTEEIDELEKHYPEIDKPVRIFYGGKDRIKTVKNQAEKLNSVLPDSNLQEFDNSGHMLHFRHAEEVAEAVRSLPL